MPGARCMYCHTDNLVAVDRAWLSTALETGHRVIRYASEALAIEEAARKKLRRGLVLAVLVSAVGLWMFAKIPLMFVESWSQAEDTWDARFSEDRALRDERDPLPFRTPRLPSIPLADCGEGGLEAPTKDALYVVPRKKITCYRSGKGDAAYLDCHLPLSVPLRKGETLQLATSPDNRETIQVRMSLATPRDRARTRSDDELDETTLSGGKPLSFVAPGDGIYELELHLHQKRVGDLKLCGTID